MEPFPTAKQKVVLNAIHELTQKSGVAPTLEELRQALGAKSISAVQRHTDALKNKGWLYQNVRGLAVYEIKEVQSMFTPRNALLGQLDSKQAVAFFRDLLWAEASLLGISTSNIQISLWVTVPDGGIDASATMPGNTRYSYGLVRPGKTAYQIKTGTSFQPWQDAAIKKELFGRKHPSRDNLGVSIRDCLDQRGTYALVCFGQEFTDDQRRLAIGSLEYYFNQCGYRYPRVAVWGQSDIVSFTKRFPSLVLQLQGFGDFHFQTRTSWAQQEDMRQLFVPGEPQQQFIKGLQEQLRRHSDKAIHIHVQAEPGVGKTRLVLEATSADDLRPLVIYCDSPDQFLSSNLMNELLKEDNGFSAIVVVDDCEPKPRSFIWNKLMPISGRIRLVTIFHEIAEDAGSTVYFDAPLLGKEQIATIIQQYGMQLNEAERWAELCDGSPRVAHLIGWNLKNNPENPLRPTDTLSDLWDRYIIGRDNKQSQVARERRLVLQYVSLFRMFGFGREVEDETKAIVELIKDVDSQMTVLKFRQVIQELRKRKILQGSTTLYITPKALHIRLWQEWWDAFGVNFDIDDFLKRIPASLQRWFYDMFVYAAISREAARVTQSLLGKTGPFQTGGDLETRSGAEFFMKLTEADPASAMRCLSQVLPKWSREKRLRLTESRQHLVWSLERIAVWRDLFGDAARALLLLAEAENATNSNNASGTFVDLFSPGPGSVAPSEASPEDRFPILQEALDSDTAERRLLAIEACDKALETNHFFRIAGAEHQGLRSAKLWQPATRDEIITHYRRVWQLLYLKVDSLPDSERNKAIDVLLSSVRGLTPVTELAETIIPDIATLAEKSFVDVKKVIETIEAMLHYGKKHDEISDEILGKWRSLRDKLVGNDFPSRMRRYVAMDLLEDKFDDDGNHVDKAEQPIQELAKQVIADPKLLESELPWLVTVEAKNGFRFAYKLGKLDQQFSLLPTLLEAQRAVATDERSSDYFIGGYLQALFESNHDQWESLLDDLAQDKQLASWLAGLTWRSGKVSDRAALRVLHLTQQGVLQVSQLRVFGYGGVVRSFSKNVFRQWVEYLLELDEEDAISIALDLCHFYYVMKEAKQQLPHDLGFTLVTHPILFRSRDRNSRDQMENYHWQEISQKFLELYPEDDLAFADVILKHFGEDGTVLEGFHNDGEPILIRIAQRRPQEVWERIAKYLGPPIDSRAFHLKSWLRGRGFFEDNEGSLSTFDPEMLWQWVNADIENRAWYLASFVPKGLFRQEGEICWARELLIRYGDREDVRRNLVANFSTEGWSGPASLHYEGKKQELLRFREDEDNEIVKRWINEYVMGLDRQIEQEKIREERGF